MTAEQPTFQHSRLIAQAALGPFLVLALALGGCERRTRSGPIATANPALSSEPALAVNQEPALAVSQPAAVGQEPEAALRVPATQTHEVSGLAPGERRPLLVVLHGLGGSGQDMFEALRLAELGARERAFVIAPDGTPDRQGRRFWNAGDACCNFDHLEVDDVARLGALIDSWRARPDIDPKRVFVLGHSNGGFMTERLACALGDRISGAVSLAGAAPPSDLPCPRSGSLKFLAVHGDADPIVRYEGGTVFDSPVTARFPSAPRGFEDWAKRQGCSGKPRHLPDIDIDASLPNAETSVTQYQNCTWGSVTLWTVHDGNHSAGIDPYALDAIWKFLTAHAP